MANSAIRIVVEEYLKWPLMESVNEAIKFAKQEIDKRTPEDTGALVKANKIVKPQLAGSFIFASVRNDTEYAAYVEYWIGMKEMNYHKRPSNSKRKKNDTRYVIRRGIGARMYTLTKDLDGQRIIDIIRQWNSSK